MSKQEEKKNTPGNWVSVGTCHSFLREESPRCELYRGSEVTYRTSDSSGPEYIKHQRPGGAQEGARGREWSLAGPAGLKRVPRGLRWCGPRRPRRGGGRRRAAAQRAAWRTPGTLAPAAATTQAG
eukprot:bmy_22242T0